MNFTPIDPHVFWFIVIVYALATATFTSYVAKAKGYSEWAWFVGGLFFSVIALIAAAGMPEKAKA